MDRINSIIFRSALQKALTSAGISVVSIQDELDNLNDLEILHRIEKAWPALTQIKSFGNFIKHDLGIGTGRCVIIIVDKSDLIVGIMKSSLALAGNSMPLITTARTFHEGNELVSYYTSMKSLCVLITDIFIDSLDPASNIADLSHSGIALIREAKRQAIFYKTDVYCVAISAPGSHISITSKAVKASDLYVPMKYAHKTLGRLVSKQIKLMEIYEPPKPKV